MREALCELEIPYLLHGAAAGSDHLAALRSRGGVVPHLFDPNTGEAASSAAAIAAHLEATCGGGRAGPAGSD